VWHRLRSLSATLSIFVALIVSLVGTSVAFLEERAWERNIDRSLVEAAQLACQSVVDDLSARDEPLDPQDLRDALHDLLSADPSLDVLSVVRRSAAGEVDVVASTSTEERAETLDLVREAFTSRSPQEDRTDTAIQAVRLVPRHPAYAAAATVGLESLLQARRRAFQTVAEFAVPTIVAITLLAFAVVRWVVGQPVRAILQTMDAAAAGRSARTPIARHDELGTIAMGLNEMLDRLDSFNQSLQDRVNEATRSLSARNAELAANQSQLLMLRESLARAERVAALGQVAANVAHQAGTPLNLVSGYVQMLRDDVRTDEHVRQRLNTVDAQIQQVIAVLRTFIDRARPAAGFRVVAVADVIEHVGELAGPRLARSGIRLTIERASALPRIRADVTQLEMAVLNLVTNALDAMPAGGTLTIAASARTGGVRLQVADSGPGIAPEVIDRLFDAWVTTKPAGQGSGLGLAIVRDVVRAHGGSVSAVNRAVGAVFTIDLPAATESEHQP
jgi:signal transduction histidine kinase